ncbi:hypothetical protein Dimus_010139 [Dionaea muscipula]
MASLVRSSNPWRRSSFSLWKSFPSLFQHPLESSSLHLLRQEPPETLTHTRNHATESGYQSPFDSNIIRILRNEIEYQSEYAPPHEPVSSFNAFAVEDNPGKQWIRLKGKFEDKEEIKIEATMFDGCVSVPKHGDDTDGESVLLHISMVVDVSKGEGSDTLEFVCSAWPDCLKIQKVYKLQQNGLPPKAYLGPIFRWSSPFIKMCD